jgi:hypothetical protein
VIGRCVKLFIPVYNTVSYIGFQKSLLSHSLGALGL